MKKGKKKRDVKKMEQKKESPQRTYAEVLRPIENILQRLEVVRPKPRVQDKEENEGESAPPPKQQGKLISSMKKNCSRPAFPPLPSRALPLGTKILNTQKKSSIPHQGAAKRLAPRTSPQSRIPSKAASKGSTTLGQLFYHHHMIASRSPLYLLFPPPIGMCDLHRSSARRQLKSTIRTSI